MVKRKKHQKKVAEVTDKSVVAQRVQPETRNVLSVDNAGSQFKVQHMSDPILLWRKSKIEHIDRTRIGKNNESSSKRKKFRNHKRLAADYHRKGDEKFLNENYREAYTDFLSAMKILGEHGNIANEFGRDMKMMRMCQDKCCICFWTLYKMEENQDFLARCFHCYEQLIEKDPLHAFWYKRRATLLHDDYQNPISAYKDFVIFAALMEDYHLTLTKEEVREIRKCYDEVKELAWLLEKDKVKAKKPSLTSDWINLWALCPCDDILLQDLLSVREEGKNPQQKSALIDSAYKDALKHTVRGYHNMAVDTLLEAYAEGQGIYRCEALLLLALIHSQLENREADHYLNTFISIWDVDQCEAPLPRRKQIFMRYISLSHAVSSTPFQNLDLSMFSAEEQVHFYTQVALTAILSLKILCTPKAMRLEMNEWNLTKLKIIKNSCDRGIKVDKKSLHVRMLREYAVMEITKIDSAGKNCNSALTLFITISKGIHRQLKPEYHSFALWCFFSAHFANQGIAAAVKYGLDLQKYLLYPGLVASFLLNNKHARSRNISEEYILNLISVAENRLQYDPENFLLHLDTATFYEYLNMNEQSYASAKLAAKYWPVHTVSGDLKLLVGSVAVMGAIVDAEEELINIRKLIEMEEKMTENPDTDPKTTDSETCEKGHPTNDVRKKKKINKKTMAIEVFDCFDLRNGKMQK